MKTSILRAAMISMKITAKDFDASNAIRVEEFSKPRLP